MTFITPPGTSPVGIPVARGTVLLGLAPAAYDSTAAAYFAAQVVAGQSLTQSQKSAVNTLCATLRLHGILSAMTGFYPGLGISAASDSINLITPGTHDITWHGGVTHATASGYIGDGSSGYGDTGISSNDASFINNLCFGLYSKTQGAEHPNDIAGSTGSSPQIGIILDYNSSLGLLYDNTDAARAIAPTYNLFQSVGMAVSSRRSTADTSGYWRGQSVITTTTAQGTLPGGTIVILAFLPASIYSNRSISCAFVGNSLTDSQVLILNEAVERFQRSLSRSQMFGNFWGDSVTAGLGVTTEQAFASILCANTGWPINNQGISGSCIADESNSITVTTINPGDNCTWLAAYNDCNVYGLDSAALTDNAAALTFLIGWCAIPFQYRQAASTGTLVGVWTSGTDFGGNQEISSALGATATFTISGTAILIGAGRYSSGGSFSVLVDGVYQGEFSCLRTAANTPGGTSISPAGFLISGLSSGSHTLVITAISAASVYLSYVSGFTSGKFNSKVLMSGCLNAANYAQSAPYNNGSPAAAAAYSSTIQNVVNSLRMAGLTNVWYTPVALDTATQYQADGLHPNASGHATIAEILLTTINEGF